MFQVHGLRLETMWKKAAAGPLPRRPVRVVPRRTGALETGRGTRGAVMFQIIAVKLRDRLCYPTLSLSRSMVSVYLKSGILHTPRHTKEVEVSFRVR